MEIVVVEKVRGLNLAFSTELWQPLPQKYSPQKYSPKKYTPQKYSLQKLHLKLTYVLFQEVFLDQLEQAEEGDREATSTFFKDGIRKVSGIGK